MVLGGYSIHDVLVSSESNSMSKLQSSHFHSPLFSRMTTMCLRSNLPATDHMIFGEVLSADRFENISSWSDDGYDTDSAFSSGFYARTHEWLVAIADKHYNNADYAKSHAPCDKYIGLEVICFPAEEGGNGLSKNVDDDDCPWSIPVESGAAPELDREENLCLYLDLDLPGDEPQDVSVMSWTLTPATPHEASVQLGAPPLDCPTSFENQDFHSVQV